MMNAITLPVEPLLRAMHLNPVHANAATVKPTDRDYAEVCSVDRRTVMRWRHNGINYLTADRIAVKVCGVHPASIWGNEWYRTTT